MMDPDGKVREASPAIERRRVRVSATRRPAIGGEPAEHHDLGPDGRGDHLGPRHGQRRASLPLARSPRTDGDERECDDDD